MREEVQVMREGIRRGCEEKDKKRRISMAGRIRGKREENPFTKTMLTILVPLPPKLSAQLPFSISPSIHRPSSGDLQA